MGSAAGGQGWSRRARSLPEEHGLQERKGAGAGGGELAMGGPGGAEKLSIGGRGATETLRADSQEALRQFSSVHMRETFPNVSQIGSFIHTPYYASSPALPILVDGRNRGPPCYLGPIFDASMFFTLRIQFVAKTTPTHLSASLEDF